MLYVLLDILRSRLDDAGLYRFVMVFDQSVFRGFLAGLLAFAGVLVFGRAVVRWLAAKKIGDAAKFDVAALDRALAAKANTPTMGGVLIAGAIAASTLLLADVRDFYVQMGLLVLVWTAALGGADDWLKLTSASRGPGGRQGLYAWEKLVFQLGLGILIGWFTFRHGDGNPSGPDLAHVLNLPFQRTYEPGAAGLNQSLLYLSAPMFVLVTMLMVTGMSNAVNITDGMDGLASGICAFVASGIFILAMIGGREFTAQYLLVPHLPYTAELSIIAGAMVGACLGFLWWNSSPAIVFMGDTGSLCLGGLIGYLAVALRQEALVLVMSGVLLIELGSVAAQVGYFKATGGKRIFRCAPYHWHLHLGGWTEQKIVVRLWIVSLILLAVALGSLKLR